MDVQSSDQRKNRLSFLRNQEHRKKQLPVFLKNLSKTIGRKFEEKDVLSIQETEKFFSKAKHDNFGKVALITTLPISQSKILKDILSGFSIILNDKLNYFTTSKAWDSFCLLIDTSFVINNFEKIIEFDGDTFYVFDPNLVNGLWIDLFEDHQNKNPLTYELRVWGADWMNKLSNINTGAIVKKVPK